ncbi:hypothetical protein Tco_1035334 [Tanacetum coccineum]
MSIRELQEQVDALALAVKQYCSNRSCSCCEGPHNGGKCPNFFNQPPQHRMETYSCEYCGGIPHLGFDSRAVQLLNQFVYEPNPGNNYDFPCFDQPPQYHIDQSPPRDLVFDSLMHTCRENNRILKEMLRTQMPNSPVVLKEHEGSYDYTEVTYDKEQCLSDHYIAPITPPAYTPSKSFLATIEPTDTLLMGDEVISTIPIREINEFIKFSVDDLVSIPMESEGKKILISILLRRNSGSIETGFYKVVEPKKSSVEYATFYEPKDEIPEVELKKLPPHLEYAFLEENNKLPVIISKDLSQDEKTSLINVLKNRKQAIAWKLSDIRGIDPEFCSHKIRR